MMYLLVVLVALNQCVQYTRAAAQLPPDLEISHTQMAYSEVVNKTVHHSRQIEDIYSLLRNATDQITSLLSKHTDSRSEIDILKNEVNGILGRKDVAFSVRLSATQYQRNGSVLKFDKITSNYGNRYDPSTGYFTCNETGLYLFSLTLEGLPHSDIDYTQDVPAAIVLDGQKLGYAVSDPISQGQDVQGSVTIVTKVTAGQKVWVTTFYRPEVNVFRTYTSFTGVLLH